MGGKGGWGGQGAVDIVHTNCALSTRYVASLIDFVNFLGFPGGGRYRAPNGDNKVKEDELKGMRLMHPCIIVRATD